MRSLVLAIFTIYFFSLPVFGWATNPSTENKTETNNQAHAVEKIDKVAQERQPSTDAFLEKTSSEKDPKNQENIAENTSLSKFNYLLYFIYKHKYQDKEMTDLEEKI